MCMRRQLDVYTFLGGGTGKRAAGILACGWFDSTSTCRGGGAGGIFSLDIECPFPSKCGDHLLKRLGNEYIGNIRERGVVNDRNNSDIARFEGS